MSKRRTTGRKPSRGRHRRAMPRSSKRVKHVRAQSSPPRKTTRTKERGPKRGIKSRSPRDRADKEITALHAVTKLLCSDRSEQRVLEKSLTLLMEFVPFKSAALYVLREDTGKLELQATIGHPQDLIERVEFDLGQGLSAWAARERKSILLRELSRPEKDGIPALGSFLAVPIAAGSTSVGVITMGHTKPNTFISEHKRILQLFCTLISGFVLSLVKAQTRQAIALA